MHCSLSGFGLCYIGNAESVSDALARADEELARVLSEAGASSLNIFRPQEGGGETPLPAAQIYDIVRFIIKELEAEHAISCGCSEGDYDIELFDDSVCVFCKKLRRAKICLDRLSGRSAGFLEIDRLKLE